MAKVAKERRELSVRCRQREQQEAEAANPNEAANEEARRVGQPGWALRLGGSGRCTGQASGPPGLGRCSALRGLQLWV